MNNNRLLTPQHSSAFQLEIHRLKNFNIRLLQTNNHILHMYYGTAKSSSGSKVTDNR